MIHVLAILTASRACVINCSNCSTPMGQRSTPICCEDEHVIDLYAAVAGAYGLRIYLRRRSRHTEVDADRISRWRDEHSVRKLPFHDLQKGTHLRANQPTGTLQRPDFHGGAWLRPRRPDGRNVRADEKLWQREAMPAPAKTAS